MTGEPLNTYFAYGCYCGYRDAAWRCLDEYGVDRLPVDVRKIAAEAGIRVISDAELHVLRPKEKGAAYYDGVRWSIVLSTDQTVEAARYTVAHELGHIFLGHGLKVDIAGQGGLTRTEMTPPCEKEADSFAVRLLCPACMLWALELHTAEEIASACRVPLTVAKKRATRMATLYKRNCFLQSELERKVFARFENYIREERVRNNLSPELNF